MSELNEIARRLQAVEGLDWSEVGKLHEEERYGDFWRVGPALVPTDFHPESDVDKADAAEANAVAEFLQHVVADMRRLIDQARNS